MFTLLSHGSYWKCVELEDVYRASAVFTAVASPNKSTDVTSNLKHLFTPKKKLKLALFSAALQPNWDKERNTIATLSVSFLIPSQCETVNPSQSQSI